VQLTRLPACSAHAAIQLVSRQKRGIVFLLWGKPAQAKEQLVDARTHHVLKAPHPSPLAGASGHVFSGCRHFSRANQLLEAQGLTRIQWALPA
jgi:uracil-DNA glycosylase